MNETKEQRRLQNELKSISIIIPLLVSLCIAEVPFPQFYKNENSTVVLVYDTDSTCVLSGFGGAIGSHADCDIRARCRISSDTLFYGFLTDVDTDIASYEVGDCYHSVQGRVLGAFLVHS